jgi:hypothetical protein
MTTLVTAFLCNVNKNILSVDQYIKYGKKLIETSIPKIVFIDETIVDQFCDNYNTLIIPFKKSDLFLFNQQDKIKNWIFSQTTPQKILKNIYYSCALKLNSYIEHAK